MIPDHKYDDDCNHDNECKLIATRYKTSAHCAARCQKKVHCDHIVCKVIFQSYDGRPFHGLCGHKCVNKATCKHPCCQFGRKHPERIRKEVQPVERPAPAAPTKAESDASNPFQRGASSRRAEVDDLASRMKALDLADEMIKKERQVVRARMRALQG